MSILEERFSAALHSSARAWRQALDRRLRTLGLSQAAWMTVAAIAKAASPRSQSELADLLGVEAPTMVSMIDRLQDAGLLLRVQSETDRRVKLVKLTRAGSRVYAKVRAEADAFRTELLIHFDKKTLQSVTTVLESLLELTGQST